MEVEFVRSGSATRAAIQEWRSRTTGRVHEVPESQSFAPAAIVDDGATGWLVYAGGRPWVGETKNEAQRMARSATAGPRPVDRAPRARGGRRADVPWALVFAVALVVVIGFAMLR